MLRSQRSIHSHDYELRVKDLLVWSVKALIHMVFWVSVLSISWDGRTLFERTQKVLSENELAVFINDELSKVVGNSVVLIKGRVERLAGTKPKQ